jgi:hypothetical protein
MEAVRKGLALYYEMYALVSDKTKELDGGIQQIEKDEFANSYAAFAAGSYIENQLGLLAQDKKPHELDKKGIQFKFALSKDNVINGVLARLYGVVNTAKKDKQFNEGIDFPLGIYEFFDHLKDTAVAQKQKFNSKLVDLVKDEQFVVEDKFTIDGYEATESSRKSATKVEFVPMLPHQVAGNVLAKKEMLRDMDRISLFDLQAGKNPVIDVGGLSWSVLYDGFPGTGKTSLFRMGRTRAEQRCKQISEFLKARNLPEITVEQIVIDQGVKNEYYGMTGKNILEKTNRAKQKNGIYILTTDDLDLLTSGDRNSGSGGSDKDILNVLMQFADGMNTVIIGNVQWWAATNDATSMDPALRQRFMARYSVDGPEEWYDFADILYDKLKIPVDKGIVQLPFGGDYKPFQMRLGQTGYEGKKEDDSGFFANVKKLFSGSGVNFRDIGELFAAKKKENPRFTGRAVNAVAEAVKKRINDYDIPNEWFEKPELFVYQDYAKRVECLRSLCRPVTPDMIAQEIERYAASEKRYANDRFDSDLKKTLHSMRVQREALKMFQTELEAQQK